MNTRLIVSLFLVLLIFCLKCSSLDLKDRREGIIKDKNVIRVFVKIQRYDENGIENPEKADERLIIIAKERFSNVIKGYNVALKDKENVDDIELMLLKNESVPIIFHRSYSEENMYAFIDFAVNEKLTAILASYEEIPVLDKETND